MNIWLKVISIIILCAFLPSEACIGYTGNLAPQAAGNRPGLWQKVKSRVWEEVRIDLKNHNVLLMLITIIMVIFIDQGTKFLAHTYLPEIFEVPKNGPIFYITNILHKPELGINAALQEIGEKLSVISLLILIIMNRASRIKFMPSLEFAITWGALLGGGLANVLDISIFNRAGIVDWLGYDISIASAILNFADIAITFGIYGAVLRVLVPTSFDRFWSYRHKIASILLYLPVRLYVLTLRLGESELSALENKIKQYDTEQKINFLDKVIKWLLMVHIYFGVLYIMFFPLLIITAGYESVKLVIWLYNKIRNNTTLDRKLHSEPAASPAAVAA